MSLEEISHTADVKFLGDHPHFLHALMHSMH